jgi:hypothetical protein
MVFHRDPKVLWRATPPCAKKAPAAPRQRRLFSGDFWLDNASGRPGATGQRPLQPIAPMVANWPRMMRLVTVKEATPITIVRVIDWGPWLGWRPGQATGTTEAAALTINAVIISAPTNESAIRWAFSKWVDMFLFPDLALRTIRPPMPRELQGACQFNNLLKIMKFYYASLVRPPFIPISVGIFRQVIARDASRP